jgi:uncharacterized protein (UPF0335 family)
VTDNPLQQFVNQIEAVNRDVKSLTVDRSEIYKAAKQKGIDVKVLRRLIAERKKSPAERAAEEDLLRQYMERVANGQPLLAEA